MFLLIAPVTLTLLTIRRIQSFMNNGVIIGGSLFKALGHLVFRAGSRVETIPRARYYHLLATGTPE